MHLLRGTGLAGLRGMQPVSVVRLRGVELRVIRPLLEVRKADTEAYCVEHNLSPRQDSSNLVPNQLRNRVRSQLLPLLREYNPDIDDSLLRLARAARAGRRVGHGSKRLAPIRSFEFGDATIEFLTGPIPPGTQPA